MDPIQLPYQISPDLYAYFRHLSGLLVPQIPSPSTPLVPPPLPKRRYRRTWTKSQIRDIFNKTLDYCKFNSSHIDDLTLTDYKIIGQGCEQAPNQIMVKVNEIRSTGTFRPGIWSQAEDNLLGILLGKEALKWGMIAEVLNREIHKGLGVRTGKACKERWNNYLDTNINREAWTNEEDILLLENYLVYGNRWSIINKSLKNRTDGAAKNRINSLINKLKQELRNFGELSEAIAKLIREKKSLVPIPSPHESIISLGNLN